MKTLDTILTILNKDDSDYTTVPIVNIKSISIEDGKIHFHTVTSGTKSFVIRDDRTITFTQMSME